MTRWWCDSSESQRLLVFTSVDTIDSADLVSLLMRSVIHGSRTNLVVSKQFRLGWEHQRNRVCFGGVCHEKRCSVSGLTWLLASVSGRREMHVTILGAESQGSIGQKNGGNAGWTQRTLRWSKALRSRAWWKSDRCNGNVGEVGWNLRLTA